VNAVSLLPSDPHGFIISAGKDLVLDVRQLGKTPGDEAEATLAGHTNNICALDVEPSGKYIMSGGWDCQAMLWTIGKWSEPTAVLDGHDGSVWAVLAYDGQTCITGT
jgi:phospholipase A-2-activating protein